MQSSGLSDAVSLGISTKRSDMVGSHPTPTNGSAGAHIAFPTDSDVIVPRRDGPRKQIDKQSTEYILKSGLAGGLAGCAVSNLVVSRYGAMLT